MPRRELLPWEGHSKKSRILGAAASSHVYYRLADFALPKFSTMKDLGLSDVGSRPYEQCQPLISTKATVWQVRSKVHACGFLPHELLSKGLVNGRKDGTAGAGYYRLDGASGKILSRCEKNVTDSVVAADLAQAVKFESFAKGRARDSQ